jgi:hypothetical protein
VLATTRQSTQHRALGIGTIKDLEQLLWINHKGVGEQHKRRLVLRRHAEAVLPVGFGPALLQIGLFNVKRGDVDTGQMGHHQGQRWLIFDLTAIANHASTRTAEQGVRGEALLDDV